MKDCQPLINPSQDSKKSELPNWSMQCLDDRSLSMIIREVKDKGRKAFDKSISRFKEIHFLFKCIYPKSYLVSSTTFGLVDFAITSNNASSEDKMSLIMGLYKDQSFSKSLVGDPSLNERLYVEVLSLLLLLLLSNIFWHGN